MNGIDFIKWWEVYTTLKIILISAFIKSCFTLQENIDNLKIDKILEKPIPLQLFKEVQKLME